MARYLKRGMDAGAIKAADAQVRQTVETILAEVEANGDAAVRALSEKFDKWSPASFKLCRQRDRTRNRPGRQARPRRHQVRTGPGAQFRREAGEALRDLEVETLPGVILGHKHIPVNSVGCYVPGGRYPMVASAHMSVVTAKVAGVGRIVACAPPYRGGPHRRHRRRHALRRGRRDLCARRRAGGRRHGARHRARSRPSTCSSARATPTSPRPSASSSAASASISSPGPTETLIIADDSVDAEICATDLLGQAEHGPTSPAMLLTTSEKLARATMAEVERLLTILPTADAAGKAWDDMGAVIVCDDDRRDGARGRPHRLASTCR